MSFVVLAYEEQLNISEMCMDLCTYKTETVISLLPIQRQRAVLVLREVENIAVGLVDLPCRGIGPALLNSTGHCRHEVFLATHQAA